MRIGVTSMNSYLSSILRPIFREGAGGLHALRVRGAAASYMAVRTSVAVDVMV